MKRKTIYTGINDQNLTMLRCEPEVAHHHIKSSCQSSRAKNNKNAISNGGCTVVLKVRLDEIGISGWGEA